jgi:uncharacterized protein (DUF697 family)
MAAKSRASNLHAKLAESLDAANAVSPPKETTTTMSLQETATKVDLALGAPVALTAEKIVNGSMILAAGAGAIPLPIWDSAAIMGVQIKMIADLAAFYGVPFEKKLGRTAIATLIGGLAPGLLARGGVGAFLKILPGVGSIFGALAQPAFAAAVTYGIGQVFIKHFKSGGTLPTFSARDFKDTLTDEVKTGFKKVSEVKL